MIFYQYGFLSRPARSLKTFVMDNNKASVDQTPANVQGNPVNGVNVTSKVFVGQSNPATLVSCHAGGEHGSSSGGTKEVCGSPVVMPRSCAETSEILLISTPAVSQTGGASPSCATPVSDSCATPVRDSLCRKTLYTRNSTSVDRRSNEIRSSMKSSSAASNCSPASLSNGNHGSNGNRGSDLSPGSRSNGNHSAGPSTGDSIFTYSLTDESHDELDEIDSKVDGQDEAKQKTLDSTDEVKSTDLQDKSNIPVPCDNNNFVDKITQVKNVIQKEYVHTIVYTFDELTSFEKNTSIMKSELCDEPLQQKSKKTAKTLSPADQKDLGHKKFSSRTVKNFLRSMSPASRHRKPSKSSESLSSRSSNTLAGSLDSASVGEDLEETGEASCKTTSRTNALSKKSPAIGKKSPAESHSSPGEKSKAMICDPATVG